jgi:hypothetical protein
LRDCDEYDKNAFETLDWFDPVLHVHDIIQTIIDGADGTLTMSTFSEISSLL